MINRNPTVNRCAIHITNGSVGSVNGLTAVLARMKHASLIARAAGFGDGRNQRHAENGHQRCQRKKEQSIHVSEVGLGLQRTVPQIKTHGDAALFTFIWRFSVISYFFENYG